MTEENAPKSKNSWVVILVFIVIAMIFILPSASCLAQGQEVERKIRAAYASLTIPASWTRQAPPHLNSPCPFDVQNNCLEMQVRYAVPEHLRVSDLLALSPMFKEDPYWGYSPTPECKRDPRSIGSTSYCYVTGDINGINALIFVHQDSEGEPEEVIMNFRRATK